MLMLIDSRRLGALTLTVQQAFLERPSLHLTDEQAERRFGIHRHVCHAVLATLVDAGVLDRDADGRYARHFPPLRQAA